MGDYKVIRNPNPTEVPLTCRCIDRGEDVVYWIHDKTKTIYVCKKPWYSDRKRNYSRRKDKIKDE